MRLVWCDALVNWLPPALAPQGSDTLTVIANGKVQALSFLPLLLSNQVFSVKMDADAYCPGI